MTAYYNEFDPYAAQWLRNLIAAGQIADGDVDERSIVDVRADDIRGYTQCHFFAGIGGWSLAARLAGWPDSRPLWTGSCPCQPFSRANSVWKRGLGRGDDRHLWPWWRDLARDLRPSVIFGEQVTDAIAAGWLDEVAGDLEKMDYSVWAGVIAALGVGAPQERERLWFVCDPDQKRRERFRDVRTTDAAAAGVSAWGEASRTGGSYRGKKWLSKPGVHLLADGLPARVVRGSAEGFGNAIVPQVAAEVIASYMEFSQ